jgi:hypothetical protein
VYLATLIGLGFVGVEMLVAIIRHGLGSEPEEIQSWIGQALLLAMSATLFILTRNLWLIVALHLIVELTLNAWATRLAARSAPQVAVPLEPEASALDDKRIILSKEAWSLIGTRLLHYLWRNRPSTYR